MKYLSITFLVFTLISCFKNDTPNNQQEALSQNEYCTFYSDGNFWTAKATSFLSNPTQAEVLLLNDSIYSISIKAIHYLDKKKYSDHQYFRLNIGDSCISNSLPHTYDLSQTNNNDYCFQMSFKDGKITKEAIENSGVGMDEHKTNFHNILNGSLTIESIDRFATSQYKTKDENGSFIIIKGEFDFVAENKLGEKREITEGYFKHRGSIHHN